MSVQPLTPDLTIRGSGSGIQSSENVRMKLIRLTRSVQVILDENEYLGQLEFLNLLCVIVPMQI